MNVDELLERHPLPWVLSHRTIGAVMYDANDQIVAQWLPKEEGAAICDAMNELVRLRDDRLRALTQYAKKAEYLRAITTLRARNAELEAFAARMRETPRRVCEALHTMSKSAFVYDVEGEDDEDAEGEDDEDAEEMCSEDTINYIADEFRVGKHNAAIFGEGPLPWDEKGGGV